MKVLLVVLSMWSTDFGYKQVDTYTFARMDRCNEVAKILQQQEPEKRIFCVLS